ncbi:putative bifunctional diguanylate cyclase/phosphodiesterase [Bradyrhizobium erythrophlei]|uniref:Diguanylate cyclase/phosphodiesterase with PAS/PAC sensor(S) n=1 Tax=Bradyrhizobium erythrophlei TaxID=1437360 RepID=A0A1H4YUI9_9BRAD|nr:EAL domain-containing protein [Bradyrhizobium erythrophlei]SED20660.1 diguanylate cyclase/phosphodiesterase with PAS/PAC sensor(s) [Bradyrhizobium erythrophlei]
MNLAAALIYWVIIALWLAVLTTVGVAFIRNPRTFGAVRLLLFVIVIDTVRNVIENLYFGLYFGGQYGLFPAAIVRVLGNPGYLLIPKVMNVVAACAVFGLLVQRWVPLACKERAEADADIHIKTRALNQEIEERRRLFDTSLDLILVTDANGIFKRVSPSSLATIGYRPDEMIDHSGAEFIYSDDLAATRKELQLARTGQYHMRNFEARYVHKNGRIVPLAWSGVWSDPEQKYFFFGRDMTERKTAEEQLRHLAHFDQLTGLPNRVSLHKDLDIILRERAGNPVLPISVATLDLDAFKDVNDTLGHSVGDKLLREVARRLTSTLDEVRVYRLGEDEFVLLLVDCGDAMVAFGVVEALLKRVGGQFDLDGHRLFIAASAGIAIAPNHGSTVDDLLANADLALYDAKAAGGRLCRLYVPTLRSQAKRRRELDMELRRACAKQEFLLYFQPQVRSSDGSIVGAEALLRWNQPERGILAPGAFIEALCESAVAIDAGRWILDSACKAAAGWRAKGLPSIRMGVNLFPAQFRNGSLLRDVEQALAESGLAPELLELEITENIALGREEGTLSPLKELRAKGIGIALDDFGTGYASLSYLTRYPLTRIKIDRSFIQQIGPQSAAEDTAIVRSIIALGCNLGLEIIAEGVKIESQADFLKAEGCHELQGFLFSKPLPAEAFEEVLQSQRRCTRSGSKVVDA